MAHSNVSRVYMVCRIMNCRGLEACRGRHRASSGADAFARVVLKEEGDLGASEGKGPRT